MTQATMDTFQTLDQTSAKQLLREAAIERQNQSGSLLPEQEEAYRNGRKDQAIGVEDAVYAMTHVDKLWPQIGKQT